MPESADRGQLVETALGVILHAPDEVGEQATRASRRGLELSSVMGPRLLLVVEDVFAVGERGVIVAPDVELDRGRTRTLAVELRRPDGSVMMAEAQATVPFVHPPQIPPRLRHVLRFVTLAKIDVPIGTEIWIDE